MKHRIALLDDRSYGPDGCSGAALDWSATSSSLGGGPFLRAHDCRWLERVWLGWRIASCDRKRRGLGSPWLATKPGFELCRE